MNENILSQLNNAQQQAVCADFGQLLVLAGAGSGKTRVLVHRIAWLLSEKNVSPFQILAVTFTNKAAGEMRQRIDHIVGFSVQSMWVGTFHSLAHRLLRLHWQEAGLANNFQILDSDDQLRMVRRITKDMSLDEKHYPPKLIQWFINQQKDEGIKPEAMNQSDMDVREKTLLTVYQVYDELCTQNGLVDFAEILWRAHYLLQTNVMLREQFQQRFQHVLVDEFQDTNKIQYEWIKLLAGDSGNLFIVGDDDQSIYGWRGAKVENIQRLQNDYPHLNLIRLEQNYRSTDTILSAANALINNNANRLGKNLWTEDAEGEPIGLYTAFNETDEARFIVSRIQACIDEGYAKRDIAILYRSNAQSRVLEENLLYANIAYRIYGGFRFFERAEIKDTLAYLRLIENLHDDASFERIVNVPARGIGEKTISDIRQTAREKYLSLWDSANYLLTEKLLASRAHKAVEQFCLLLEEIRGNVVQLDLPEQVIYVLDASGLLDYYRNEKGQAGVAKVENLEELVNAAREFEHDGSEPLSPLASFLSKASLDMGDKAGDDEKDEVQLMTLHAAKGLEFHTVFMCGMEESLFPHFRSVGDAKGLEEERRLCYVGMTRTMKKLYMTHAEVRHIYGSQKSHRPSRFLREIPSEYMQEMGGRIKTIRTANHQSSKNSLSMSVSASEGGFDLGQRVCHKTFGDGVILSFEGKGAHTRVQVQFDEDGESKWLVLAYAKLQPVGMCEST